MAKIGDESLGALAKEVDPAGGLGDIGISYGSHRDCHSRPVPYGGVSSNVTKLSHKRKRMVARRR
jgi:hypothetical protein